MKKILGEIRDIAKSSNNTYGNRGIRKVLNALDYPVGRWKTRSLMRGLTRKRDIGSSIR
ncbi:hypothetical protein SAMN05216419_100422 [Nitrosomonas cryotolerans]|nr:hypothetical protein SAMN05216419_100422 [Nitrosomonas cryotolerans]